MFVTIQFHRWLLISSLHVIISRIVFVVVVLISNRWLINQKFKIFNATNLNIRWEFNGEKTKWHWYYLIYLPLESFHALQFQSWTTTADPCLNSKMWHIQIIPEFFHLIRFKSLLLSLYDGKKADMDLEISSPIDKQRIFKWKITTTTTTKSKSKSVRSISIKWKWLDISIKRGMHTSNQCSWRHCVFEIVQSSWVSMQWLSKNMSHIHTGRERGSLKFNAIRTIRFTCLSIPIAMSKPVHSSQDVHFTLLFLQVIRGKLIVFNGNR